MGNPIQCECFAPVQSTTHTDVDGASGGGDVAPVNSLTDPGHAAETVSPASSMSEAVQALRPVIEKLVDVLQQLTDVLQQLPATGAGPTLPPPVHGTALTIPMLPPPFSDDHAQAPAAKTAGQLIDGAAGSIASFEQLVTAKEAALAARPNGDPAIPAEEQIVGMQRQQLAALQDLVSFATDNISALPSEPNSVKLNLPDGYPAADSSSATLGQLVTTATNLGVGRDAVVSTSGVYTQELAAVKMSMLIGGTIAGADDVDTIAAFKQELQSQVPV